MNNIYINCERLLNKCIDAGLLTAEKAIWVVTRNEDGTEKTVLAPFDDCAESLSKDREGYEYLINALKEKGYDFEEVVLPNLGDSDA